MDTLRAFLDKRSSIDPLRNPAQQAAKRLKAQMLIIVSTNDHIQRPETAREFARLVAARIVELHSDCGHLATDCEAGRVADEVNTFLGR
jgi:homoserine O-acetyltransferase/O-succinyltransferase